VHERKWPLLIGRICLGIVSAGLLVFGAIVAAVPMGADVGLYRANGLATFGLGLFGGLLVLGPYRRVELWAWYALWFYPLFWAAHLIGQLPPGTDHIHQVVFIALSLTGLLVPVRIFFPRAKGSEYGDEGAAS
jgi:MFS family permease